jgi:flagellar hook protein FlgE
MSQGLFSAVSGIRANQLALSVIANNLANVNTTSFKASGVNFQTVFSDTIAGGTAPSPDIGGTNPLQIGNGVTLSDIPLDFAQGGSQFTGRNTDMEIQGEGFFTLEKVDRSGVPGFYLTRAGNFTMDANGNLTAASGNRVLGTQTIDGDDQTLVMPVNIPQEVTIYKEVDRTTGAVVRTWLGNPADDDTATINGPGVRVDDTDVTTRLDSRTVALTNFAVGTDGGVIATYANGDRISVENDATGVFREIRHIAAEGYTFSQDGVGTDNTVQVFGANPNDPAKAYIAPEQLQLRIATVTNPAGLVSEGNNNWNLSANSGVASFGIGNNNNRGIIQAGALESSNVDIAQEFTNMIIHQRGLEASSKAVSVQSDVLRTIIGIL